MFISGKFLGPYVIIFSVGIFLSSVVIAASEKHATDSELAQCEPEADLYKAQSIKDWEVTVEGWKITKKWRVEEGQQRIAEKIARSSIEEVKGLEGVKHMPTGRAELKNWESHDLPILRCLAKVRLDALSSGNTRAAQSLSRTPQPRDITETGASRAPATSQVSNSSVSRVEQPTSDSGKIYDGLVTDNCVRYRPLQKSGTLSWYQLSNGCTETINVFHSGVSGVGLGSMMTLRAGKSDKSWFANDVANGIYYAACKETILGNKVYLDKALGRCYYRSK